MLDKVLPVDKMIGFIFFPIYSINGRLTKSIEAILYANTPKSSRKQRKNQMVKNRIFFSQRN